MSFLDPDSIIILGVAIFFDIFGIFFWGLQFIGIELGEINEILEYLIVDIPPLIIIGAWMILKNQDIQQLQTRIAQRRKIRGARMRRMPRIRGIRILRRFSLIFLGEFMPGIESILPWPMWTITVLQTIREGERVTTEARAEAISFSKK